MSRNNKFHSLDRICHYSVVNESIGCFFNIYCWIKSSNKLLEMSFTKLETVLSTMRTYAILFTADKLKPIDQVIDEKLEKLEIFYPFVRDEILLKPLKIYSNSTKHINSFSLKSSISSFFNNIDVDEIIYKFIETIFDKFIPEIDDTNDFSSDLMHKNHKPRYLSKKTFHRLSKLTMKEIEQFSKSNDEYLEKVEIIIRYIQKENTSNISGESSSIIQLMENISNNMKQLEHSLSNFKITPQDNFTLDLAACLEFLKKNIAKLQIIIFDSKLEFVGNKFFNQMNFLMDQIRSGLNSLYFHLRNFTNYNSKSSPMNTDLIDSYFSKENGDLSDCTLYESDYEEY